MIKKFIKKIFIIFGIQINKLAPQNNATYQLVQALNLYGVTVVFDIGANIGQFADELKFYGYKGKIISFEPLSDAHNTLMKRSHTIADHNWTIHPRSAVGSACGEIAINVSENSVSSSILPMLDSHSNVAPQSGYVHTEQVPIITLDSVINQYIIDSDIIFIKIDTQGYEWSVLDGASYALKKSVGVLLELSLLPLYQGQRLWLDCINRLASLHFNVYALQPAFINNKTGQMLQVDGIFFKDKNDNKT